MKALGTVGDGGCDPDVDTDCTVFDIGKNMWYYTFEFDKPALVTARLDAQLTRLSPEDGLPFDTYTDEWGYEIYDTEIARRFNLFVNSPTAAMASRIQDRWASWSTKQGILFQGGPADIFTRRIVLSGYLRPSGGQPLRLRERASAWRWMMPG